MTTGLSGKRVNYESAEAERMAGTVVHQIEVQQNELMRLEESVELLKLRLEFILRPVEPSPMKADTNPVDPMVQRTSNLAGSLENNSTRITITIMTINEILYRLDL